MQQTKLRDAEVLSRDIQPCIIVWKGSSNDIKHIVLAVLKPMTQREFVDKNVVNTTVIYTREHTKASQGSSVWKV